MSILIVDDSADSRRLITLMLEAAGYSGLRTAASAREAFRLLSRSDPAGAAPEVELILMDVLMPETDGIAACRQIKATECLRDIPIIMVTGNPDAESLQGAFAAGAMDYITKPLHRGELLARVRSALRLKHEMDHRKAREQELLEATRQLEEANKRLEQAMVALDDKHRLLQEEQERSERLLLNILPKPIADLLKQGQRVIADSAAEVTVLFADIVDFTQLSARLVAGEVVALLNEVFSGFDRLAEKHGLEKIKTIGDAYMAVGGLPTPRPDHAEAVAEMALDMQRELAAHTTATGQELRVRIGIHTGPVIAGVMGTKKFIYDLWGDTVNTASRMESHGLAGGIQVTAATYEKLRDKYEFRERGMVLVKGKGEMVTYLLTGRKKTAAG